MLLPNVRPAFVLALQAPTNAQLIQHGLHTVQWEVQHQHTCLPEAGCKTASKLATHSLLHACLQTMLPVLAPKTSANLALLCSLTSHHH